MYKAPLKEIRFDLHQLLDISTLSGFTAFSEYTTEFIDSVLDEAAKFAEGVLDPINRVGDKEGAKWTPEGVRMPKQFKDAYQQFSEGGWQQLRAAPEFGGQGAPTVLGTAIEELWASSNLAFKLCPMLTQGAIEALHQCGSAALQRKFLPKMVTGEWSGTMNLTEPQAGSDLAAVRTRAVAEGDQYRLFGQKIFITYGDHDYTSNIIHMVLARVEGAPAGVKGISLFLVPKVLVNDDGSLGARNEVSTVSIEHKLGIHGSPTCILSYGDQKGAVGYLIGEENRGLEYMFIMMNAARLSVGLEGYALAERSYQQALAYARTRIQGKPAQSASEPAVKSLPIAYHADIKRMLLTMKSLTDAARAIALYAAFNLDLARHHTDANVRKSTQARGDLLIPIVKAWSTELGIELTSLGVQIHGGMGFIEETGAAQYYRDVRITAIYEGTTGIQAIDLVGRKVSRDRGAAMTALIDDMIASLNALTATDQAAIVSRRAALDAINVLRDATQFILQQAERGAQYTQAVAVPYLKLNGLVIGGWLLARSHDLAVAKQTQDPDFYASKQQLCRFYAESILPQVYALKPLFAGSNDSVVSADPALF
jgi:alkylation response protein AidB-like acyl-CoA dehydrogenase